MTNHNGGKKYTKTDKICSGFYKYITLTHTELEGQDYDKKIPIKTANGG